MFSLAFTLPTLINILNIDISCVMQKTFKKRYFTCELVRFCFKKWIHLNWPENQFSRICRSVTHIESFSFKTKKWVKSIKYHSFWTCSPNFSLQIQVLTRVNAFLKFAVFAILYENRKSSRTFLFSINNVFFTWICLFGYLKELNVEFSSNLSFVWK